MLKAINTLPPGESRAIHERLGLGTYVWVGVFVYVCGCLCVCESDCVCGYAYVYVYLYLSECILIGDTSPKENKIMEEHKRLRSV